MEAGHSLYCISITYYQTISIIIVIAELGISLSNRILFTARLSEGWNLKAQASNTPVLINTSWAMLTKIKQLEPFPEAKSFSEFYDEV